MTSGCRSRTSSPSSKAAGFGVHKVDGPVGIPAGRGTTRPSTPAPGASYQVTLPDADGSVVDKLDHTVVERAMFNDVLGMDAADKRIAYVGGDYGADWLRAEVDEGRAQAAIMIASVSTDDFVVIYDGTGRRRCRASRRGSPPRPAPAWSSPSSDPAGPGPRRQNPPLGASIGVS